jgi:hypothetical protein
MTQKGRNMYECVTIDDKALFVHFLVISVFASISVNMRNVTYCVSYSLRYVLYT